MKSVLVTGGAGYIGSGLVRDLLSHGYEVHVVDNLRFGGAALIDVWGHPGFTFSKLDITDFGAVETLFAGRRFDAIVHLAAIVGDPACKQEPELARRTNLDSSVNLLGLARRNGVSRFIFASTCSNYGKMADRDAYVDERSALAPVSLYAELKVAFEDHLLNNIEKTPDFMPVALRFATVYGLSARMRFDLTVNEFVRDFALERELTVFGEQFWRPYCHVRDFSRAIQAVLEAPPEKMAYDVFNVGDTTENYTKKLIVDALLQLVPDGKVSYVHRDEDPRDYRVDFSKIRDVLGFKISRTVPDGLREILSAVRLGLIDDPDSPRYHNSHPAMAAQPQRTAFSSMNASAASQPAVAPR